MWEFVDKRDSLSLAAVMAANNLYMWSGTQNAISHKSCICVYSLTVRRYKRNVLINFLMNFQVYFVRHLVCLASSNVLSSSVTSVNICSLNLHKVEIHMQDTHGKRDTKWKTHTYSDVELFGKRLFI